MASEVISHAIFASSHSTPHRIVFLSASHPVLRSTSRPRFTPHPSLHPPSIPPELHPAPHHALHPAPRPYSQPLISIALLCSPGFLYPSPSFHVTPSSSRPPISHPRLSPSVSLSQAPPADFLVRKKARFTHDMTFFHHDVRGKRFNAHEGSHKMEMIISKDHVAEKPRRGWDLWRHGRP